MSWKNKYSKAVTFSYDDGVLQDERFVKILNRYNLKCTFNINSGISRGTHPFQAGDIIVDRFDMDELIPLYEGHEVAAHTVSHPVLTELTEEEIRRELIEDKEAIEKRFGSVVEGMAYPFGAYDDKVVRLLEDLGFKYARTVDNNWKCHVQEDLLRFKPTCHHNNPNIFSLIDNFLKSDAEESQIFYIWGHSYEFDVDQNWKHFEKICEMLSGHDDVFYGTNGQVLVEE